jgi:catechol 2,3-dioxygenase-like lactoylglutathione lyase family enzyme
MTTVNSTTVNRPPATGGMRHVALFVNKLEDCVAFYCDLLGMTMEWNPDPDNFYLTSGNDNLALHRYNGAEREPATQRLDHIGFILKTPDDVDSWFAFLSAHNVEVRQPPKTHRDGARSFYCADPDGNVVQMIYHPPIS